MNLVLIGVVIALKFLVPIGLLWWPFPAVWLNYFLDVIDGDVLQELGLDEFNYQTIDKIADLFSYVFMLIAGLKWRIRKTIIILFVYRMIGQIGFLITRNEFIFIYFQNFLEPLIMLYTLIIFMNKSEEKAYLVYKRYWYIVWFIVLAYKLWNEWYLHWANIDLSTYFFGVTGGK